MVACGYPPALAVYKLAASLGALARLGRRAKARQVNEMTAGREGKDGWLWQIWLYSLCPACDFVRGPKKEENAIKGHPDTPKARRGCPDCGILSDAVAVQGCDALAADLFTTVFEIRGD